MSSKKKISIEEIMLKKDITIKDIFRFLSRHKQISFVEYKKICKKIKEIVGMEIPHSGCRDLLATLIGHNKYCHIQMYLRAHETDKIPNLSFEKTVEELFSQDGVVFKNINFYKALAVSDQLN